MSSITENPSNSLRNYVLGILVVVYTFNFIDRQILSILLESIKNDLNLSDTSLGMLTGFAFALFYATLGIPIAKYADYGNRRNLISLAIGIWSFMTALSGLAQNFFHLLIARIGGMATALSAMPKIDTLVDYSVGYKSEKRDAWSFLKGEMKDVRVLVKQHEIPENLKNKNYMEDSTYRENFKKWVEVIWVDKDESISNLKF